MKNHETVEIGKSVEHTKGENEIKKEDICFNCFGASMGDCDRCTRYAEQKEEDRDFKSKHTI